MNDVGLDVVPEWALLVIIARQHITVAAALLGRARMRYDSQLYDVPKRSIADSGKFCSCRHNFAAPGLEISSPGRINYQ